MTSIEIPQFLRKEPAVEKITERKWEVLACVANGMQLEQIAQHLGISYYTVEAHIEQICTGATLCSGVHRSIVLTPLIAEGVETGRIVVDDVPDELKLTKRQLEVKDLMLHGHRIPEVAYELDIFPITAEGHFRNIYKKLGAKNFYHAIAKLIAYGICQEEQAAQRELKFAEAVRG